MGYGTYSSTDRMNRATTQGFYTNSLRQTFSSTQVEFDDLAADDSMNPKQVILREARDSEEHPNSVAIVLGLDVTGSMGRIPGDLVKDGLPTLVSSIIDGGVLDPQLLFMGIGDHKCDNAPLQIGQFESSDELMDQWLTKIWLEGHGGGNGGESYFLAWYFASQHTATDCWDKRNIKGFVFTIGDEPCHRNIPSSNLKQIMENSSGEVFNSLSLLNAAREKYNVYHIHVREGSNGQRQEVVDGWRELIGSDSLLIAEHYQDIPQMIVDKISENANEILQAERTVNRRLDI